MIAVGDMKNRYNEKYVINIIISFVYLNFLDNFLN